MTNQIKNKLTDSGKKYYHHINQRGGDWLTILGVAMRHFTHTRAVEAAASIAYYAFFSLFPMLLTFITVGSMFFEEEFIHNIVQQAIPDLFPVSQDLILANVESIFARRGAVSIVALVGLVWAATSVFYILARSINRAWPEADMRSFLKNRFMALGIVAFLILLLLLSFIANMLVGIFSSLSLFWFSPYQKMMVRVFSTILPVIIKFVILFWLYHWIPNCKVPVKAASLGAFVAVAGLELVWFSFRWYLQSGVAQYDLVYGSLGAIITLMLWIYLTGMITLWGAHLSAAIAHVKRKK